MQSFSCLSNLLSVMHFFILSISLHAIPAFNSTEIYLKYLWKSIYSRGVSKMILVAESMCLIRIKVNEKRRFKTL